MAQLSIVVAVVLAQLVTVASQHIEPALLLVRLEVVTTAEQSIGVGIEIFQWYYAMVEIDGLGQDVISRAILMDYSVM
tara:strand:- start:1056 stop:1289 length:234 start_codon:yes stop_codon:yes gene_type:complete